MKAQHLRRSEKTGLPPGSLVYVGTQKDSPVAIEQYRCEGNELEISRPAPAAVAPPRAGFAWINIDGVHDVSLLEHIGTAFGLHPLTVEDILNTDQRPKVEDYDAYLFIVLKMLRVDPHGRGILAEQTSLVLTESAVVSFQQDIAGDAFQPVRDRLSAGKGRIRGGGADYLCYALIDAVVDNYFIILENVGERIEHLEERLLVAPSTDVQRSIHALKRELIALRKSVWPLREVVAALQRNESPLISSQTALFFRDVHDHTVQVIETLETYRDMVSGLLDLYMTSMSNRMNEIMKVLTIIATIFIPVTFIAGVYGMNFRAMPELDWPYGYAFAWGVMLAMVGGMLVYFRRKRWI